MLSTPPAFILSQDQTLMLKVRPAKINHLALLFWFKDLHLLNVLENKIYSKNFQGCIVVYLSKFIFCCCHSRDSLFNISHLFLHVNNFFKIFLLFLTKFVNRNNEIEYIIRIVFCQHQFCIFLKQFLKSPKTLIISAFSDFSFFNRISR